MAMTVEGYDEEEEYVQTSLMCLNLTFLLFFGACLLMLYWIMTYPYSACWTCPYVLIQSALTSSAGCNQLICQTIFLTMACAIYSNWWPMLSALMYVLVPMPCMFFGGGSTEYLLSRDGGGWIDAAKFLTGASAVGSIAIPIILRHAHLISTGAMLIEFISFFIFVCTVMCFHRANLEDEW